MAKTEQAIEGKIITSQIGSFGKAEFPYGYITIEISSSRNITVKIDYYTWFETLEIGKHVVVDASYLGTTDILVARKVSLKTLIDSNAATEDIAVST
ncbi:MAG: hypothetical protein ACFFCT_03275 [Candidatus Odinarchaeota archaeon]